MTCIVWITANYENLPLYIIAKGKTKRCEEDLRRGINMRSFKKWLDNSRSHVQLSEILPRTDKLFLLLELYKAHRCLAVRQLALELNIEFLYLPAGATELNHPLDIQVFGGLKAKAQGLWYEKFAALSNQCTAIYLLRELSKGCMGAAWSGNKDLNMDESNDEQIINKFNLDPHKIEDVTQKKE